MRFLRVQTNTALDGHLKKVLPLDSDNDSPSTSTPVTVKSDRWKGEDEEEEAVKVSCGYDAYLYFFIRARSTITASIQHNEIYIFSMGHTRGFLLALARGGFRTRATGSYVTLSGALTIRLRSRDPMYDIMLPH